MVIIKIKLIIFFIFFLVSNNLKSSEILDFETEIFINNLINQVKEINNIERKIKFRIISNKNINAFVDVNNIITVTSGLIENSPDYVALLSVLAHEVGHIDLQHIHLRKNANKKISAYKQFSNLTIIVPC